MTDLNKRVKRRCLITKDAGRRIVVALEAGDEILLRREHGRRWLRISVLEVYHLAVKRALGLKRKTRG